MWPKRKLFYPTGAHTFYIDYQVRAGSSQPRSWLALQHNPPSPRTRALVRALAPSTRHGVNVACVGFARSSRPSAQQAFPGRSPRVCHGSGLGTFRAAVSSGRAVAGRRTCLARRLDLVQRDWFAGRSGVRLLRVRWRCCCCCCGLTVSGPGCEAEVAAAVLSGEKGGSG